MPTLPLVNSTLNIYVLASEGNNIEVVCHQPKYAIPLSAGCRLRYHPVSYQERNPMITCHLRYVLDASKLKEFEHYGKVWIPLVKKFGGIHHGYLLPSEGASNIALASFSFPSLAAFFRPVFE
jgi:hypothetical protein